MGRPIGRPVPKPSGEGHVASSNPSAVFLSSRSMEWPRLGLSQAAEQAWLWDTAYTLLPLAPGDLLCVRDLQPISRSQLFTMFPELSNHRVMFSCCRPCAAL